MQIKDTVFAYATSCSHRVLYVYSHTIIYMLPETLSIKVTPTAHSRIGEVDFDNLPFGRIFSDHMLVMEYKDGEWQQPEIMAFGN